jgi:membrane protease YdiL (CAAX protease family)
VRARHHAGTDVLIGPANLPADVGIGIGVGVLGIFISTLVAGLVADLVQNVTHHPLPKIDQLGLGSQQPSTAVLAIVGVTVMVLAPIAEETFFRGFLFRGFRRWASPVAAALLSGLLFAFVHIEPPHWGQSVIVMAGVFPLGVMFAFVVEWRGSIIPTMVAHLTFNAFGFWAQFIHK